MQLNDNKTGYKFYYTKNGLGLWMRIQDLNLVFKMSLII